VLNGVAIDPHVWLDPANARAMAVAIHDILRSIYRASSDRLDANHARLLAELEALDAAMQAKLGPVAALRYLVLHDAYQYLEVRYGLAGAGALSATPEPQAGPRRLAALRKAVQGLNVTCMFAEPGIDTRALAAVTEGSRVRTAVLDPEGTRLEPGPELYGRLMRDLASAMVGCLGAT
jgi:zinc transport system substrate-binding protein